MKYAYDIEAYRNGDDAELFPLPQKWFESPLTTGSVFQHENYELCFTEIEKDARGGEPTPEGLGAGEG